MGKKNTFFLKNILKERVKKVLIKEDIFTILTIVQPPGEKCIKREVEVIYDLVIYNIGGLYFPKLTNGFSKQTCLYFLNPQVRLFTYRLQKFVRPN